MKLIIPIIFLSLLAQAETIQFNLNYQPHQKIYLASNLNNWSTDTLPLTETSPGQYLLSLTSPWLKEIEYKFVVNQTWIQDPNCQNNVPDNFGGWNCLRQTSFHEDPSLILQPGARAFQQINLQIQTTQNDKKRKAILLLPPEWENEQNKKETLLYFQDGLDYLNLASVQNILANRKAKNPDEHFLAILLPTDNRELEYSLGPESQIYAQTFAESLSPKIESYLKSIKPFEIQNRVLIGDSLGGQISLYIATKYSQKFSIVVSQSGAFYKNSALFENLLGESLKLKILLDVGIYENAKFIEGNKKIQQFAKNAGHQVSYQEYPSTHDWIAWRNRLNITFDWLQSKPKTF